MIEIDGAMGEGGGQVLRTSLSLSMATGESFRLANIRAGRRKPGLMRQHLACVRAAAEICGASVVGAEVGSKELTFSPGPVRAGDYHFAVGSAGSSNLVAQTVLLPLVLADFEGAGALAEGHPHARVLAFTDLPGDAAVLASLIEAYMADREAAGAAIRAAWATRWSFDVFAEKARALLVDLTA